MSKEQKPVTMYWEDISFAHKDCSVLICYVDGGMTFVHKAHWRDGHADPCDDGWYTFTAPSELQRLDGAREPQYWMPMPYPSKHWGRQPPEA